MSYENAWKEIVNIVENIKDTKMDGDIDSVILCIEHLQSELAERP